MGQVIYLNTLYYPPFDEVLRLDFYQNELEKYHAELAYKSREMTAFDKALYKQKSHKNVQKTWQLLDGGKVAESA